MKKNILLYFSLISLTIIFITQFISYDIFNFWKFIASSIILTLTIKEAVLLFSNERSLYIHEKKNFAFNFITFTYSILIYISLYILIPFSISNLSVYVSIEALKNILLGSCSFLFISLIYILILYYFVEKRENIEKTSKAS